jgi:hypothetical protein
MRRAFHSILRRAPCRLHEIFMHAEMQRTGRASPLTLYRVSKSVDNAIASISAYRYHSFLLFLSE